MRQVTDLLRLVSATLYDIAGRNGYDEPLINVELEEDMNKLALECLNTARRIERQKDAAVKSTSPNP